MVMEFMLEDIAEAAKKAARSEENKRCFDLVMDVINKQMITWPESADSQLWNQRLDRLTNSLIDAFYVEAK
jgi:hypothetical protein